MHLNLVRSCETPSDPTRCPLPPWVPSRLWVLCSACAARPRPSLHSQPCGLCSLCGLRCALWPVRVACESVRAPTVSVSFYLASQALVGSRCSSLVLAPCAAFVFCTSPLFRCSMLCSAAHSVLLVLPFLPRPFQSPINQSAQPSAMFNICITHCSAEQALLRIPSIFYAALHSVEFPVIDRLETGYIVRSPSECIHSRVILNLSFRINNLQSITLHSARVFANNPCIILESCAIVHPMLQVSPSNKQALRLARTFTMQRKLFANDA